MPNDPAASRRAELIGRVAGAQLAMEGVIASLRASGQSVPAELDGRLAELIATRKDIATASPGDLAGMERAVAALVTSAAGTVQQAQAAASAQAAEAVMVAAEGAQRAAASAMEYARTVPLRFASGEDERGYRERESEREAYMRAQQAKGTPEGQLNASGAAIGQLLDAHAHGASGPEFDKQWNDLVTSTEKLRDRLRAQGGSTKEFDNRLRDELRCVMKAKGLSDAEIDSRFAATPDPLEAAKAVLVDGNDLRAVDKSVSKVAVHSDPAPQPIVSANTPAMKVSSDEMMEQFRLAGVRMSPFQPGDAPDPGLRNQGRTTGGAGRSA